ncbi:hypothetical protein KKG41_03085 [Patescibacteria group bacterium]|nr:hypothetical protein [Patescibacteria group bacterium]MBU1890256.1 hypothetical protein [Patescibacteria group bacterium]
MKLRQIPIISLALFALIFTTGCLDGGDGGGLIDVAKKQRAIDSCQSECRQRRVVDDYSNGPCLSNSVQPDWVCDIAHKPREEIDNEPQNQCTDYIQDKAHHFVELDTSCNLIRAE